MKLRDLLPRIADKFHPEPELTPELAAFLRARFGRAHLPSLRNLWGSDTVSDIDNRILINALATQVPWRSLYSCRVRGVPEYRECGSCRHFFGEDEDFYGDVDRCNKCYEEDGYFYCEGCDEHKTGACSDCNECDRCCDCERCAYCREVTSDRCANCDCCDRHCDGCRHCDDCGDYYTNGGCSDCDRCSSCCECNTGPDESYHPRAQSHPAIGRQKLFTCRRMVGVEVEYNLSKDFEPIKAWARQWGAGVHADGSCGVDDNASGWEAVSAPAAGDLLVRQLNQLTKAFDDAEARFNDYCGIHVHVDARDLRWPDIYRLCKLYAHVEPFLYLIGGQSRSRNGYCAPVGDRYREAVEAADPKESLLKTVYRKAYYATAGGRSFRRQGGKPHKKEGSCTEDPKDSWGRYVGLNLCPWISGRAQANYVEKDTTVEFRLHREYTRPDRLIGWAKLCARIVDFAAHATDAEVDALRGLSAARALTKIAPDLASWILDRLREYKRAVRPWNRLIGYQPSLGYSFGKQPRTAKIQTALAA